jgi:hypothetical protein
MVYLFLSNLIVHMTYHAKSTIKKMAVLLADSPFKKAPLQFKLHGLKSGFKNLSNCPYGARNLLAVSFSFKLTNFGV